jgi:HlyD family secretion protein
MKKLLVIAAVVVVLAGAGYWYVQAHGAAGPSFKTAKVERGKFYATVGATGTTQPEDIIDVGAQVNGRVERFGADPRYTATPAMVSSVSGVFSAAVIAAVPIKTIDYGSPVDKGTILAVLDASLYETAASSARANLAKAEADLELNRAKLDLAERDMDRATQLLASKANAQADYDAARATALTAKSQIKVNEAMVHQTKAQLDQALINLDYCIIRSPVKGVIVDRRVNVGQTVVSSLNAPSLFLIAKDLRRMQLWAQVNEADMGAVSLEQSVTFTVDMWPDRTFKGKVSQIRLNASNTQNVVTYTVVVGFDNSDQALLPYLTANLQFEVQHKDDALKVPNAALRWKPQQSQVVPGKDREWWAKVLNPKKDARPGAAPDKAKEVSVVWVQDGDYVRPIRVKAGLTDGTVTEIFPLPNHPIEAGQDIVVREDRQAGGPGGGGSPFTPTMFGGKKKE